MHHVGLVEHILTDKGGQVLEELLGLESMCLRIEGSNVFLGDLVPDLINVLVVVEVLEDLGELLISGLVVSSLKWKGHINGLEIGNTPSSEDSQEIFGASGNYNTVGPIKFKLLDIERFK